MKNLNEVLAINDNQIQVEVKQISQIKAPKDITSCAIVSKSEFYGSSELMFMDVREKVKLMVPEGYGGIKTMFYLDQLYVCYPF